MSRYIRQEALSEIDSQGQKLIRNFSVAIVGVGALGSCTAELLARAGVGRILLVDNDVVDLTNLQRQLLFDEGDIGKSKVSAALKKLQKINSEIHIEARKELLSDANAGMLDEYKLILDCTDNMKARHTINDYCDSKRKIWIYSAAVGTTGNVLVVEEYVKFRKVFKSGESFDNCENIGVLNSVIATTSAMQVAEAIKIMTGNLHSKELLRFDAWNPELKKIEF